MSVFPISVSSTYHKPIDRKQTAKIIVQLVAKIALGILIVPLISASYRKWVARSIKELKGLEPLPLQVAPWYAKLGPYPYDPLLDQDEKARESKVEEFQRRYEASPSTLKTDQPLMGHVNWIPGEFGVWMPGTALVGAYLAGKRKLKGLIVCNTLDAFQSKLTEVVNSPGDQRAAFIIPTFKGGSQNSGKGFVPNFAQHKVPIVLEKIGNELHIACLDGQPTGQNRDINPSHVQCDKPWDDWKVRDAFNSQELAFRAITKAALPANTHLYYTTVVREGNYGCAVFALRDAVAFLRDPQFFQKIQVGDDVVQLHNGMKIKRITELPAAHVIGAQSSSTIESFLSKHTEAKDLAIPGKNKTLTDYLKKNRVEVKGRLQNHYITRKMFKYNEIVLQAMERLTPAEINQAIQSTLVN